MPEKSPLEAAVGALSGEIVTTAAGHAALSARAQLMMAVVTQQSDLRRQISDLQAAGHSAAAAYLQRMLDAQNPAPLALPAAPQKKRGRPSKQPQSPGGAADGTFPRIPHENAD